MMKKIGLLCALLLLLASIPQAHAVEGSALLSLDDLLSIEGSYEAFLNDLEDLAISRGLLSESERSAWHDAQIGDFFSNGGYGSILINYTPGVLSYLREEESAVTLRTPIGGLFLELRTLRRYTPGDSGAEGLPLSFSVTDAEGLPVPCRFDVQASDGIFYQWDAVSQRYVAVGQAASSEGESLLWGCQTPAEGASSPFLEIVLTDEADEPLGSATLTLSVQERSYRVAEDALVEEEG